MASKKEIPETNNIVKIQDSSKERDYIYSTAIRMRPRIYDKYGCIIWQIKQSQVFFAKNILFENGVKYWGLEIEEDENGEEITPIKVKETSQRGSGYDLNVYQIKLIKIPPIKHIQ